MAAFSRAAFCALMASVCASGAGASGSGASPAEPSRVAVPPRTALRRTERSSCFLAGALPKHHGRGGGTMAVAPGESFAVAADTDNDRVAVVSLAHDAVRVDHTITVGRAPAQVAAGSDGRVFVTERAANQVSVYDVASGTLLCRARTAADPVGIALSPDEATVYVTSGITHRLTAIDTETFATRWSLDVPREPRGVAVAPYGRTVYVAHLAGMPLSRIDVDGAEPQLHAMPSLAVSSENRPLRIVPHWRFRERFWFEDEFKPEGDRPGEGASGRGLVIGGVAVGTSLGTVGGSGASGGSTNTMTNTGVRSPLVFDARDSNLRETSGTGTFTGNRPSTSNSHTTPNPNSAPTPNSHTNPSPNSAPTSNSSPTPNPNSAPTPNSHTTPNSAPTPNSHTNATPNSPATPNSHTNPSPNSAPTSNSAPTPNSHATSNTTPTPADGRIHPHPSQAWSVAFAPGDDSPLVAFMVNRTGSEVPQFERRDAYGAGSVAPGADEKISFAIARYDAESDRWATVLLPERLRSPTHNGTIRIPSALGIDPRSGGVVVAAMGTNRIARLDENGRLTSAPAETIAAPCAVAVLHDGREVVFSQLAHAIQVRDGASRIDVAVGEESLDPQVAHGRALFYSAGDRRISSGGLACGGCHPEGRDDGLVWFLAHGPRQTPTLAGRLAHPFNWNGTADTLTDNIVQTIHRLGGEGVKRSEAEALAAFLERGLVAPNVERPVALDEHVRRGRELFEGEASCSACHDAQHNFTDGFTHVLGGLRHDETRRSFDTPSLHFLDSTAPYFHDGRYPTLHAMLVDSRHHMGHADQLAPGDLDALEAYLHTL